MKKLLILIAALVINTLTAQASDYNYLNEKSLPSYKMHTQSMQTVEVLGKSMAYIDSGEGPVILLTHGVPTNSWLYRKMIPLLTNKGYRVIAPDMIGFGLSEKSSDMHDYTPRSQAQRMLALMNHLQIDSWTHLVHDMSGLIAWELLEMDPQRIDKLILLNSFAYKRGFNPPADFGKKIMSPMKWMYKKMIKRKRMLLLTSMIKCGVTLKNWKLINKNVMRGYFTPVTQGEDIAILDFLSNFRRMKKEFPRYQQTLRDNAHKKTLVIWGKKDSVLKGKKLIPQFKRDLKIEDKNIHILKDAKHFIQEEKPKTIVKLIDNFLKAN